MGFSQEVLKATGGFSGLRFGEDIDMSIRIMAAGFKTCLLPEAYVFHKRRTSFRKFFKQVYNSGMARINLYLLHPHSLKLVHFLPACFVIGCLLCLLGGIFFSWYCLLPLLLLIFVFFIDSWRLNKRIKGRVFVDCGCFYSVICLWNRFHSCRFCSFDIEKTGERHVRAEFL